MDDRTRDTADRDPAAESRAGANPAMGSDDPTLPESPQNPPADIHATQRLPGIPDVPQPGPARRLSYGHSRDIGMVRSNNEDSTLAFLSSQNNTQGNPDFGVFIVADGAGGHEDGEQASMLASRIVMDMISQRIYLPMLLRHIEVDQEPIPPLAEVLTEAVQVADSRLRAEVPGGGTTLTAAVIIGDLAHIAHVGDSRAYLITGGGNQPARISQLTRDHSVAKRLEEIGQITASEAAHHPEVSRLWKMLGLSDNLEPDINTRRLPADSWLLLCSDGLWNMVSDSEIAAIVAGAATAQEAADRLVLTANTYGGLDNISAIVVRVP